MTSPILTLPNGMQRPLEAVVAGVDKYAHDYPAVFDLYDYPDGGPHDTVLPIDVLAPNALNAWGKGQPMSAMTEAWKVRDDIARVVAPISKQPLEHLSNSEVAAEVEKVAAALTRINQIWGYGEVTTPKFLHRLRPNLVPIWDKWVEKWYGDCGGWATWVQRVYSEVREPDTQRCLIAGQARTNPPLSLLRVWDLLLWQWAAELP